MTLPKPGDVALYHLDENGVDEVVHVRVHTIAPPWTTGTVPVLVAIIGRGDQRWVPLSLLDFEGVDVP
jgi:hypothetical protein